MMLWEFSFVRKILTASALPLSATDAIASILLPTGWFCRKVIFKHHARTIVGTMVNTLFLPAAERAGPGVMHLFPFLLLNKFLIWGK